MSNMYNLMLSTIDSLLIGENATIPVPENIRYFRKYLCEYGKAKGKKFTTKIIGSDLHIMRVKYSNIYSKEIE